MNSRKSKPLPQTARLPDLSDTGQPQTKENRADHGDCIVGKDPTDRAGMNSHAIMCRPYGTAIASKCPVGT